jgi:CheY-like chemotaxis protein
MPRVLVVDDEERVRGLLCDLLAAWGHLIMLICTFRVSSAIIGSSLLSIFRIFQAL